MTNQSSESDLRHFDISTAARYLENVARETSPEYALESVLEAWMGFYPDREGFVMITCEAMREWAKRNDVQLTGVVPG